MKEQNENFNVKIYNTLEKRIATVKKKGNIITFKETFFPRGTANQGFTQILVTGFRKDKSGAVKIEGRAFDSNWYSSINDLIDAVDFELLGEWHEDERKIFTNFF